MKALKIKQTGTAIRIYLDDEEIEGVTGFTLHKSVGEITTLNLDIIVRDIDVEIEADEII